MVIIFRLKNQRREPLDLLHVLPADLIQIIHLCLHAFILFPLHKAPPQTDRYTAHQPVIIRGLRICLNIGGDFFKISLRLIPLFVAQIEGSEIQVDDVFFVRQLIFFTITESGQIVIQRNRRISTVQKGNRKDIISPGNHVPLLRLIQIGDSSGNGLKKLLALVQHIVGLARIIVGKPQKLWIPRLFCILFDIRTVFQCFLGIGAAVLHHSVHPRHHSFTVFLEFHVPIPPLSLVSL